MPQAKEYSHLQAAFEAQGTSPASLPEMTLSTPSAQQDSAHESSQQPAKADGSKTTRVNPPRSIRGTIMAPNFIKPGFSASGFLVRGFMGFRKNRLSAQSSGDGVESAKGKDGVDAALLQKSPRAPANRAKKHRSKSGLSGLSGVLTFACVLGFAMLGAVGYIESGRDARGPLQSDLVLNFPQGTERADIVRLLEQNQVIDNGFVFTALTFLDGIHNKLRAGEYLFKAGISPREIEDMLVNGRIMLHAVTIPEGLTSEQIAQRLKDNEFLQGSVKAVPQEGSLLPETYKIARGTSMSQFLNIMAQMQKKQLEEIWAHRAQDLPLRSPYELVIMASVVEKETGKADERAHVAGVFYNRLQKKMKIQSDPTVVYGLVHGKGTLGHSITRAELEQITPFNTYVIDGLPPAPITNPGRAALEAAANPMRTADLYFVADGTGEHVFAQNLADHNRNVQRWRQLVRERNDLKDDHLSPDIAVPDTGPGASSFRATHSGAIEPLVMPDDPIKVFGSLGVPDDMGGIAGAALDGKKSTAMPAKLVASLALRLVKSGDRLMKDVPSGTFEGFDSQTPSLATPDLGAHDPASASTPVEMALNSSTPRNGTPRIFDASEGTSLDPLRNNTYDLNYPKIVPDEKSLKAVR